MYWSGSGYPTEQSSSDQEPSEIVAVEVTPRPMMLRGPRLPLFDEAKKKQFAPNRPLRAGSLCIALAVVLLGSLARAEEVRIIGDHPGTSISVLVPTGENGHTTLSYGDWTDVGEPPHAEEWTTVTGINGVGYEQDPTAPHLGTDYSSPIGPDLSAAMYKRSTTPYIRYTFSLDDALLRPWNPAGRS